MMTGEGIDLSILSPSTDRSGWDASMLSSTDCWSSEASARSRALPIRKLGIAVAGLTLVVEIQKHVLVLKMECRYSDFFVCILCVVFLKTLIYYYFI